MPGPAAALALAALLAPATAGAAPPSGYVRCRDRDKAAAALRLPPRPPRPPPSVRERDMAELEAEVRRFEEEAAEYRQHIQQLVERTLGERHRFLSEHYEQALRDLEVMERKERQDAIQQFEEFVSRYPDDPTYTPDAMFRLAELYYERANDDYDQEMARWREEARRAVAEGREPPPEPQKGYAPSIAIYRRLLAGFPQYRFLHGVTYLIAYCLGETGQGEEAQRAYASLIERFPQSPFVPEAWVRLGDWHFDDVRPDSLRRAAQAFSRMYDWPDHPLYARAVYKLGWTYYRMDDFAHAVEAFTRLLDHYVAEARKTGSRPGGEVWPEAVQYVAVSFADERGGGVARARSWFASLGGRPYEAEIYARLGDVYYEQTRFADAVAAYRLVIARAPLSPEAPKIQAKIVQALARDRRFEEEARERQVLVAAYDDKSAWWQANKGDPDLLKEVRELGENSLSRAAAFHHAQAQAHKQAGKLEMAVAEYREAAAAYGEYLRRFPRSKAAYELQYAYADCLYNSLDFERAARTYADVRDDPADDKYRAEAALSAVISWEGEVTRLEHLGRIPERKVILSKDRAPGEVPKAETLPAALEGLVRDSDVLAARLPGHPKAPAIAYKAGEVFYTHGDFDEARCRFEDVIARWPKADVVQYAANLIIESHLAERSWKAVVDAAERLQKADLGGGAELARALQKFKLGGRFNLAMQLMEEKSYDEAGRLFLALVDEDPRHEFADKALYNAASCFESARRFESALRLYERVSAEYPGSAFADAALFRVAWNAENTYDFDKAVDRYLALVERYPKSKHRKDSLYNAARSLENLQRYEPAAAAFARYAKLYPDAEDAARTQFHAALIYEKTREWRREIQALQDFARRFSRSKEHELLVQAQLKVGLAYRELGQEKEAGKAWEAAVAEFARRRLVPESHPVAAAAAAEASFRLAERDFERFDRIRLPATTNPKKLKKALEAKLAEMKKVAPRYDAVKRYKRPDWTLAAFYRQAYLLERLAQTLYEAPVPPEFRRPGQEEYLAAYQDQLAQFAQPFEDQAVAVYVQAIGAARELHVKNEWTRKISESLARYRPREYPVLEEPKGRMLLEDRSPEPLADSAEGPRRRPRSEPVRAPSVAKAGAAPEGKPAETKGTAEAAAAGPRPGEVK